ncbi:MAG: hypothetical protein H0U49_06895 [Parachlamydiaceae bacterium]|nr:hypothetical protein [Parachlamydiaceae bacterium]
MRNMLSAIFFSVLLMSSSAYAAHDQDCHERHHRHDCHENCPFDGGCFIGVRPNADATQPGIIDQFIFDPDGTVYFNQSNALVFPNTTGTFAPSIGTWKVEDCHVIATVVGFAAAPVALEGGGTDLNVSNYQRATFKFKIINKHTLRAVQRVFRDFSFDEDPLCDEGTVVLNSFAQFDLRKVKVKECDLNVF